MDPACRSCKFGDAVEMTSAHLEEEEIREPCEQDRECWESLARDYMHFYEQEVHDQQYESTWRALLLGRPAKALLATHNDEVVGFSHYLFTESTWGGSSCYLQDLFVADEHRCRHWGRRLIEATAIRARQCGASRLYWLTHVDNGRARRLYDTVAKHHGFICYDYKFRA